MKRKFGVALAFSTLLAIVGCGGSTVAGTDENPRIRVVNALASPATTDVYIGDELVASDAAPNTVSNYRIFDNGNRTVQFRDGGSGTVLINYEGLFELNRHYTVVGYSDGADRQALVLTDTDDQGEGQVGIRFAKVAAGVAESVDVYITAPDASIVDATPTFADVTTGSTEFGYQKLPAGTYRVRVTGHNLKVPLIDDTVTVQSGNSITLLDNGTTEFVRLNDES